MKSIAFAAFALVLAAAGAAEAQTVISRQVKSEPVETVVTRQPNGTLTTSRRVMNSQNASMRMPQRAVKASAKPATKIIYRTIVRREIVQAPQPQVVLVREPVTTLVPSIIPPFVHPVTTMRERAVYASYPAPTLASTPYTPSYQIVDDEDDTPVVRTYAPAHAPGTYVVRY